MLSMPKIMCLRVRVCVLGVCVCCPQYVHTIMRNTLLHAALVLFFSASLHSYAHTKYP